MLNFFAPINTLGYGIHSFNLIKAYEDEYREDICLIPPFGGVTYSQDNQIPVDAWLSNRIGFNPKDPSIMIFNEPFLAQFSGTPRIGFPVFETEKFDDISRQMIKSLDWILTPSEWGRRVIHSEIPSSPGVFVVPEGYDPEIFYPEYSKEYKLDRIKKQGITFVHVGKIEERKGTLDIFTCFDKAFSESKIPVELFAHVKNQFNPDWYKDINTLLYSLNFEGYGGGLKKGNLTIHILDTTFSSSRDMANLYRSADFGIWLSKAEGWGLPLMECIACGTPALTTRNTGMTEYLEEYPKELIMPSLRKETVKNFQWFKGDRGSWEIPNLNFVIEKLKDIGHNPEKYLDREKECTFSIEKFTWKNSAICLREVLKEIGVRD